MKKVFIVAAAAAFGLAANGAWAGTVVVNSFAADNSTAGVWGISDTRTGTDSSVSIVAVAPTGDPLGPGAGLITTLNNGIGEVGVSNNYGTAASIISTINLDYSYFKTANPSDLAGAPSIKLTFVNAADAGTGNDRGFVTLVYEPYWNNGGTTPPGTWLTDSIDGTTGEFWATKGFGQAGGAGGPPLNTLAGWLASLNSTSNNAFGAATLEGVEIGIGTGDPNEIGYFDNVSINGTAIANTTYDFEPTAVPLPSAVSMGLGMLGLMGAAGLLRKKLRTA